MISAPEDTLTLPLQCIAGPGRQHPPQKTQQGQKQQQQPKQQQQRQHDPAEQEEKGSQLQKQSGHCAIGKNQLSM